MKRAFWILLILLFLALFIESQFQSTPTLEELKALRAIRGEVPGSIVWSTSRHGTWQIYKMKADGTDKIRLTHDQESNGDPVWSKDGKWIYFQRNSDIYRMSSDGSNPQMVIGNGFSFDINEDNTKIVYVIQEQNEDLILLHDLEKGTTDEIVPARVPEFEGKDLRYPTLSPNGEWLAFSSTYPSAWSIHLVRLDGTDLFFLDYGCMPHYRPDGLMLVWVARGHDIYIGSSDGKEKKVFENSIPGRPHTYFPRWSNDGLHIVFAASPHRDRSTSDYEIYIKPTKEGEAVRLTFHPATDISPDFYFPFEKGKAVPLD